MPSRVIPSWVGSAYPRPASAISWTIVARTAPTREATSPRTTNGTRGVPAGTGSRSHRESSTPTAKGTIVMKSDDTNSPAARAT